MGSNFYSRDGDRKQWDNAGLKDFGDYSDKVTYCNQRSCSEYSEGEWFYADDATMTIYHGSYGNYNAPGSGSTYADVFGDREEYEDGKEEWQHHPEYDEDDCGAEDDYEDEEDYEDDDV